MALFGITALTLLSGQGHASQAPFAPLSIAADAAHLSGAAIWIGGLPCLIAVLLRAPRALPENGRALAGATLARFSKVALWSVLVISVTGLVRMVGELDSVAQLWSTGYGRDLMLKASLLAPILILARRNRRMVAALAGGGAGAPPIGKKPRPPPRPLPPPRPTRRMVAALAGGLTPTAARLRTVARSVQMELMIAMGIITIAAILVAQVPGRV